MKGQVRAWVLAARPKTLPAAVVPVWAGCLLGWQLAGVFDGWLAAVTLAGAIFLQIATNFFNDVIDAEKGADTERRKGPSRATASGWLSRGAVYRGGFVMLGLAVVCGVILFGARGWPILAIGVPSLYLCYGYTGGPFPLAYRGMGEVFVILFFGLVAVGGTYFVQTGEWDLLAGVAGLQVGLLSAVLIAVNNYRDLEEDEVVGKRTLVVRWGRAVMGRVIYGMTILPAILVLCFWGREGVEIWFGLAVLWAVIFWWLERVMLKADGVSSKLLGLSALHLILFVVSQSVSLALSN